MRVVITCKSRDFTCWAMAIVWRGVRIDGIDWEAVVRDHRGNKCRGWHRHVWDERTSTADGKECLETFHPTSMRGFVEDGLRVMGVELKEGGDHGSQQDLAL